MKDLLEQLELTHQETSLRLKAAEEHKNTIGIDLFSDEILRGQTAMGTNIGAKMLLLAGTQMLRAYLEKDETGSRPSMKMLATRFKTISEDDLRAEITAGQDALDNLNLTTPTLIYHMGRSILAGIVAKYAIHEVAARN